MGHPIRGSPRARQRQGCMLKERSTNKVKGAVAADDDYAALGQEAQLTIPSAGTSSISNPGDPTISGSFLLTKDDFEDGNLPTKIEYQVRWIQSELDAGDGSKRTA